MVANDGVSGFLSEQDEGELCCSWPGGLDCGAIVRDESGEEDAFREEAEGEGEEIEPVMGTDALSWLNGARDDVACVEAVGFVMVAGCMT